MQVLDLLLLQEINRTLVLQPTVPLTCLILPLAKLVLLRATQRPLALRLVQAYVALLHYGHLRHPRKLLYFIYFLLL